MNNTDSNPKGKKGKNMNKYIMILDTETISATEKKFVYDIGFIVAKLEGNEYKPIEKSQMIVSNIYDNKELFQTAYYANKRIKYTNLMKGRKVEKSKIGYIMQSIAYTLKRYNIKEVYAYNSPFDKSVFDFNCEYYKLKNPFDNKKWVDILVIANHYIHNHKDYLEFVEKNNFINPSGYIQTNAEKTQAFLTNNPDYVEEHTSLQDCEIELNILNKCIDRGYHGEGEIKLRQRFIKTKNIYQYLNIIVNGNTHRFKYLTKKNTRKGIVLKS